MLLLLALKTYKTTLAWKFQALSDFVGIVLYVFLFGVNHNKYDSQK